MCHQGFFLSKVLLGVGGEGKSGAIMGLGSLFEFELDLGSESNGLGVSARDSIFGVVGSERGVRSRFGVVVEGESLS